MEHLEEYLERLIDPSEWSQTLNIIKQTIDLPMEYEKEKLQLAKQLEDWIVNPVLAYNQIIWEHMGNKHCNATNAGTAFFSAAEDLIDEIKSKGFCLDERVNIMDRRWREWQAEVGFSGWLTDQYFKDRQRAKASKSRGGTDIRTIVEKLCKSYPDLSSSELWPHMYSALSDKFGDVIEDGNQKRIKMCKYKYINDFGNSRSLGFRTFSNYVSETRKKLSN